MASGNKGFGNAWYIRKLFEKILENQALRLASNGNSDRGALQRIRGEEISGVRCQGLGLSSLRSDHNLRGVG